MQSKAFYINDQFLPLPPPPAGYSSYSPDEELRSLSVIATDGQFDSDPIHVNVTIVNANRRVGIRPDSVDIQCRSTGVTERLSELLQVWLRFLIASFS